MDIFGEHAAKVGEVMSYLGDNCPTFTWTTPTKVFTIKILPGSLRRSKNLEAGGFLKLADLTFVVRTADLPDPGPGLKQTITYLGDEFRVEGITKLAGDTLRRFEVVDIDQAASAR